MECLFFQKNSLQVFLLKYNCYEIVIDQAILYKMIGSCVLAAPQMSVTFATVVGLNGGTFEDMKKKIKQDIPATWLAGNVFWIPINLIQYRFTPLYYRATVGSVCGGMLIDSMIHVQQYGISIQQNNQQNLFKMMSRKNCFQQTKLHSGQKQR